jgi:hypothetical protein
MASTLHWFPTHHDDALLEALRGELDVEPSDNDCDDLDCVLAWLQENDPCHRPRGHTLIVGGTCAKGGHAITSEADIYTWRSKDGTIGQRTCRECQRAGQRYRYWHMGGKEKRRLRYLGFERSQQTATTETGRRRKATQRQRQPNTRSTRQPANQSG